MHRDAFPHAHETESAALRASRPGRTAAVVGDLHLDARVEIAQPHVHTARQGVLHDVGQGLLGDTVDRQRDPVRHRIRLPVDGEGHVERLTAGALHQAGQVLQVGRGLAGRLRLLRRRLPGLGTQHTEQTAQFLDRGASRLLDGVQRRARQFPVGVDHPARGTRLDAHHRHVVCDHVVQFARDTQPFGHDGAPRVLLLRAPQLLRPVRQLGLPTRGQPRHLAEEVGRQEEHRVEPDVVQHGGQQRVERPTRAGELDGRLDEQPDDRDAEPDEHRDDDGDPCPTGRDAAALPRAGAVDGEEQSDGGHHVLAHSPCLRHDEEHSDRGEGRERIASPHDDRRHDGSTPQHLFAERHVVVEGQPHASDHDDREHRTGEHGQRHQHVVALLPTGGQRTPPPRPAGFLVALHSCHARQRNKAGAAVRTDRRTPPRCSRRAPARRDVRRRRAGRPPGSDRTARRARAASPVRGSGSRGSARRRGW